MILPPDMIGESHRTYIRRAYLGISASRVDYQLNPFVGWTVCGPRLLMRLTDESTMKNTMRYLGPAALSTVDEPIS